MFDKLKRVFGLGSNDENDDLISDDPDIQPTVGLPLNTNGFTQPENNGATVYDVTIEIFNHVVEQFNRALPDFLRKSVDPDREKQQLLESLSADIKQHLENLKGNVTAEIGEAWRKEREKLQTELKSLSKTAKDIENKRAELKAQQLSAERQKRAMTERISDLEKRTMALEAEKEQLELENKSMINKVKVAQVYEKEVEELRAHIAELQSDANKQMVDRHGSEEGAATVNIDPNPELLTEIELLKEDNEQLNKRVDELSKTEKDYKELLKQMDVIEEQLNKIDEMQTAKNSKIDSLTAELKAARKELEDRNEELKKSALQIESLKAELDESKQNLTHPSGGVTLAFEPEPAEAKTEGNIVKITEDDDILNDTDWIVRPEKINRENNRKIEKIKPKKQNNREDGQMSLW